MSNLGVTPPNPASSLRGDPQWYKTAIIYQMHVRSFCDSNADGIGDFPGLISRLDYLEELGVTAVWLLPFYPSPLKDDGYDIADFTAVNPAYGAIEDVRSFVEEAHRRQIRVIAELVINHTSDQHRWFQRARRAPRGSPEREFYVWSDSPDKYAGARIVFKDYEPGNWTFDHVAGQYYFHRFFHHQPDLNFDNPLVHDAVFQICDFWMSLGVDGVRLDGVPYLYEREGTSCENLPETHAFLRKLRAHVDRSWPNRMLLAEANQWPEDVIAYFGENGDECHMNFHFPLMPRLFMALRMEDRFPIIDILEQTPPIPPQSQWAMFLRNHDELTLEMVTDEERDYMWRVYASDPAARINLGIRRRLAPLLDNNRRKIELMNALLLSLPGSPIIYYGDEIGMGDNIFLGDRNGVRTPMQWSSDRNAGFSRATPQRLFLPVIIDPEYHYEAVNVDTQAINPSSLLWWMRRLIALRKRHPVFGMGDMRFLTPGNNKVLAFLRTDAEEQVLVVANLSRFAQPLELHLPEGAGATPVEMFGNVRFPAISENGSLSLSIGPHGFYWFTLDRSAAAQVPPAAEVPMPAIEVLRLDDPLFEQLLVSRLARLLPQHRWFVSKARTIRAVHVLDRISFSPPNQSCTRALFLIHVDYTEGEADTYALPLSATLADPEAAPPTFGVFMRIADGAGNLWLLRDGMSEPQFGTELLHVALHSRGLFGRGMRVSGRRIGDIAVDESQLEPKIPDREQSNSNIVFGEQLILKLYRRLDEGANPELEIGEHLTTRVQFPHTAALIGAIETASAGRRYTLGVVMKYVANEGDAWQVFLDHAQRFYEGLDALTQQQADDLCLPREPACEPGEAPPEAVATQIAQPLEMARLLGRRTAELHAALADDRAEASFTPEPYSLVYQRSLLQSLRNSTIATLDALKRRMQMLNVESRSMAQQLIARELEILTLFRTLTARPMRIPRIRIHGDYHLGQVLWTGRDAVIIDFEGEPLRSIGTRRLKRSPLRDVAGMVRSFDYVAWTALRQHWALIAPEPNSAPAQRDVRGAAIWSAWLSHEFVRDYIAKLRELRPDMLPSSAEHISGVLQMWILEKALYEIRYELNARPDWVQIPLRAALEVLGSADKEGKP